MVLRLYLAETKTLSNTADCQRSGADLRLPNPSQPNRGASKFCSTRSFAPSSTIGCCGLRPSIAVPLRNPLIQNRLSVWELKKVEV